MKESIVYFDSPGHENTQQVLSLVKDRAQARDIRKLVLASTRGKLYRLHMRNSSQPRQPVELQMTPFKFTEPWGLPRITALNAYTEILAGIE